MNNDEILNNIRRLVRFYLQNASLLNYERMERLQPDPSKKISYQIFFVITWDVVSPNQLSSQLASQLCVEPFCVEPFKQRSMHINIIIVYYLPSKVFFTMYRTKAYLLIPSYSAYIAVNYTTQCHQKNVTLTWYR